MGLSDDIAGDMLAIFNATDEFAKPATYRPKAGGSLDITVIQDFGENLSSGGRSSEAATTFLINRTEVPEPKRSDEIDLDGKTWTVERIAGGDGYVWKVEACRDLRATFKR